MEPDPAVIPDSPHIAAVTHGNVALVAADQDLLALRDNAAVHDAGIDRRLCAAVADRFDFLDAVGQLEEALAAREELRPEVRSQAEAEDRDLELVHDAAELVDLIRVQELALVDDHDVGPALQIELIQVRRGADALRVRLQTDAGANHARAVPVVRGGLDEPDRHVVLFVIILCDQRLRGLGRAHGAVFEIELCHTEASFPIMLSAAPYACREGRRTGKAGPYTRFSPLDSMVCL